MAKKPIKKTSASVTPKSPPATDVVLFGPPPIIEGEDEAAYKAMCKRFLDEVGPEDLIEKIWVQDVVYHTFRMQKMRRQLAMLLSASKYRGMKDLLEPLCGYRSAGELAEGWAQGDEEAIERVEELFDGAGFTIEMVQAQTLAAIIKDVERIEQLIGNAESFRNSILREMEQRRSRLTNALRKVTEPEDAEFREIKPRGLTASVDAEMIEQGETSGVTEADSAGIKESGETDEGTRDVDLDEAVYVEAAE